MLDLSTFNPQAVTTAEPTPVFADSKVVAAVFQTMFGYYGTAFAAKYSNGQKDSENKDKGLEITKRVWAAGLAKFDAKAIKAALDSLETERSSYPPSWPEFAALCRANQAKTVYPAPIFSIAPPYRGSSPLVRRIREVNAANLARRKNIKNQGDNP